MKCPKCKKENKAGAKTCEFCNAKLIVRKKTANTKKKTSQDITNETKKADTKKVSTKSAIKSTKKVNAVKEEKKEPIIEFHEEKKELKKLIKKIKKIDKIIYIYVLMVLVALLLIVLINKESHTITCKSENKTNNSLYTIIVKMKYDEDNLKEFTYITKNKLKDSNKKEFKDLYNTMLEGLKTKNKFNEVVKAKLNNNSYVLTYNFKENNFSLTEDFIDLDISSYQNNVRDFQKELESVGFTCK